MHVIILNNAKKTKQQTNKQTKYSLYASLHVTGSILCVLKRSELTIVGARAAGTLSMPALLFGWAIRAGDRAVVHGGSLKMRSMVRMV